MYYPPKTHPSGDGEREKSDAEANQRRQNLRHPRILQRSARSGRHPGKGRRGHAKGQHGFQPRIERPLRWIDHDGNAAT